MSVESEHSDDYEPEPDAFDRLDDGMKYLAYHCEDDGLLKGSTYSSIPFKESQFYSKGTNAAIAIKIEFMAAGKLPWIVDPAAPIIPTPVAQASIQVSQFAPMDSLKIVNHVELNLFKDEVTKRVSNGTQVHVGTFIDPKAKTIILLKLKANTAAS